MTKTTGRWEVVKWLYAPLGSRYYVGVACKGESENGTWERASGRLTKREAAALAADLNRGDCAPDSALTLATEATEGGTERCEGCGASRGDHEAPETWYDDTMLTPDGPVRIIRCPDCW